jgi:hypothetical protein
MYVRFLYFYSTNIYDKQSEKKGMQGIHYNKIGGKHL